MGKRIFAVIGGLISGSICIWLMESLGHFLYPLPENVKPTDIEAFKAYVSGLPFAALLLVLVGYSLGAVVSGYISTKIANDGKNRYAVICGVFFLLATVYNMYMLPTPVWFWVLGTAVWSLVLIGYQLALKNNKV